MIIKPDWTSKFGIIGMSGSGKTYLSRSIQACYPRVIIIDIMHEYHDGIVVDNFDDFAEKMLELEHADEFRIIYHVDLSDENFDKVFEEILFLSFERGSVLVDIEEIQEHSSAHLLPRMLRKLLMLGRHRKVAFIFTTQSPGLLNKKIVSQMHYLFLGRCYEPNDIDYLSRIMGRETTERLLELPPRKFLKWQPGNQPELILNNLTKTDSDIAE